jgi:hypothetical protein
MWYITEKDCVKIDVIRVVLIGFLSKINFSYGGPIMHVWA